MADVWYAPRAALDPTTARPINNVDVQVYAPTDSAFTAPLSIKDSSGVVKASVQVQNYILPGFYAPEGGVVVRSGSWITPINGDAGQEALTQATAAVATADAAAAAAASVQGSLLGIPANAQGLGCVANDTTPAVAAANTSIINLALQAGNVYLPPGVWWINDALRIPSDRSLTGAGMELTWVKMANGVNRNYPCITNASNLYEPRTDPDVNIYIADLSVDGNSINRAFAEYFNDTETGSGISLACVEHALVERVYATNCTAAHSFDVTSSVYAPTTNTDVSYYPPGPSKWVTFRNCRGGSSGDDAFTTHGSQYILFDNCVAWNEEGIPRNTYSNGFEIDDHSMDVTVQNCYAYKFHAGVQVKGHTTNAPARRVAIVDCVADSCQYGFDIWWNDLSTAPPLPEYAPAADVQVIRCQALNLYDVQGTDSGGTGYHPALRIRSYNRVHVQDFLMRDCPMSNVILEFGCSNVTIDGLIAENCWNNPNSPDAGLIAVNGDAGDNLVIRNIEARGDYPLENPIVRVTGSTRQPFTIERIRGVGTGDAVLRGAVECTGSYGAGWIVRDVYTSGFIADIRNASGTFTGRVPAPRLALSSTSNLNCTTTATVVPGLSGTITVLPGASISVTVSLDVGNSTADGGTFIGVLRVDGVDSSEQMNIGFGTAFPLRSAAAKTWILTGLSPGAHTLDFRGRNTAGTNYIVRQPHSTLTATTY